MAKTVDGIDIPPHIQESIHQFGLLPVRAGDVLGRIIYIPHDLLKPGEPEVQTDFEWIDKVTSQWVSTGDYDLRGNFSTGGDLPITMGPETGIAKILVKDILDNGTYHLRGVIAHCPTKEDYLLFRKEMVGNNVPAGYMRLRGTDLMPTMEEIGPLEFRWEEGLDKVIIIS
ncbi:hypothetical protein A3J78_00155 [Candidatus Beckwithbacteria bacterium RBG_13_35_6]|uniref:Uncharacterized protein n=1 Tax=Candidatus Beckwithbacteria bacterium RBG_13_35_6 TaxID=1797456 RepID=A0A1F5DE51_9BACT|nr:MAG: hypothetical protein A3J78_00155 [Candidatus Beckwithbacteria bacterium RBG_13_35_6]